MQCVFEDPFSFVQKQGASARFRAKKRVFFQEFLARKSPELVTHKKRKEKNPLFPDPPILAFFAFLAFFVLRFRLLFCAFLLSFPRIFRVRQRGTFCIWVKWGRFAFLGVSQILVKTSTWRQCPQMLAGKARKKAPKSEECAKSTQFYPSFGHFWAPKPLSNWGKTQKCQIDPTLPPHLYILVFCWGVLAFWAKRQGVEGQGSHTSELVSVVFRAWRGALALWSFAQTRPRNGFWPHQAIRAHF